MWLLFPCCSFRAEFAVTERNARDTALVVLGSK